MLDGNMAHYKLNKAVSTRHVCDPFEIGSWPVVRVHMGEPGTSVQVSRDHPATRNERARTVRDRSRLVDFVTWMFAKSAAVIARPIDLIVPRYV